MQAKVSAAMACFLEDQDTSRVRAVLREELAFRRAGCEPLLRSWSADEAAVAVGSTMLVAFGGLCAAGVRTRCPVWLLRGCAVAAA